MVNPNRFYTYAYLREDRTPYYIGKGQIRSPSKDAYNRCYYGKHHVPIPPKERILILKTFHIEFDAYKHEIYMISVFGRKDIGTGILRNLSNGGEGHSGRIKSKEEIEKIKKSKKGARWWNDGKKDKCCKKCPGSNWVLGRINSPKFSSDLKWWNNGLKNKLSSKCPDENWKRGRIMKSYGICWNNGKIDKMSKECPGPEWTKGSLNKTSTGMRWWNDGIISVQSKECPGKNWVLGMLGTRGTKYWNNGIIDRRFKENPGEGWILGRLHGHRKSKNAC
jgi:hypothetical protein